MTEQPISLAILMDFDNTAAEQNVAELLLRRFARDGWQDLRRTFQEGHITLREYQELAFRTGSAGPAEMQAYVRQHASLRPGFGPLVAYARDHDIALAVVTNGLDFYAEALLCPYLVQGVRLYAVGTRFTPQGIQYLYPHQRLTCCQYGTCKCAVQEAYRAQGRRIVYIGDSVRTDLRPALQADARFACQNLLEHCRREGIPHLEFVDFYGVQEALESGALLEAIATGDQARD